MAQNKGSDKPQTAKRKGGLGRGLAALIPSGPSNSPALGDPLETRGTEPSHSPGPGDSVNTRGVKPNTSPSLSGTTGTRRAGSSNSPGLGGGAADIILGGMAGARSARLVTGNAHGRKPAMEKVEPKSESALQQAAEPATKAEEAQPQVSAPQQSEQSTEFGATYLEIPIEQIRPNPQQPRHEFDPQALDELVHSISEFGLMQPIVVRRSEDGYELIMGERRWRASKRAGLDVIPAIVRETEDSAMLRDALLENIHRVQLNPLEEAAAYQQLLEEFGVTQAELADKLGRSRPVITNMIRLLGLPVNVQTKVAAGVLSAGHARALLGLKSGEEAQDVLATRIIAEGLSVRATEELVLLTNRGDEEEKKPPREKAPTPEVFTRAAESLADNLDTKVSVSMGKGKGKLVVEFGDKDDFERIMSLIQGQ